MAVHNLEANFQPNEKLNLSWTIQIPLGSKSLNAISIEVSLTSDMKESQHYILPPTVEGCTLDVGKGNWFFRAGSWIGDKGNGVIEWSGTYGPVPIISKKPPPQTPQTPFILQYIRPLNQGIRVHYMTKESFPKYYAVFQTWKAEDPNKVKTFYFQDSFAEGKYELMGLEQESEIQFRFACAGKELPSSTIIPLTGWTKGKGKSLGKSYHLQVQSTDKLNRIQDSLLVKGAKEKNLRFESHTDYIKYLQAKARIG